MGKNLSLDTSNLSQLNIPENDAIVCDADMSKKNELPEDRLISTFQVASGKKCLPETIEEWDGIYRRCLRLLDDMEYDLECYADGLSRKYVAEQEKRKRDMACGQKIAFAATPEIDSKIADLKNERDRRLQQLKMPQMSPSLSFQDQLNVENALKQGDILIRHYIRCLSAVSIGSFLLLIGICMLLAIGLFTVLQTYVFQDASSILCYLAYTGIVFVFMLFCWLLPYNYFRHKLRFCISDVQDAAKKHISGYYKKAKQFDTYINLLNQLDFITRYLRLLTKARKTSNRLSRGYLWHKVQIQLHLSKLQFFCGLMDHGVPAEGDFPCVLPDIDGARVNDYIDSQLYWP